MSVSQLGFGSLVSGKAAASSATNIKTRPLYENGKEGEPRELFMLSEYSEDAEIDAEHVPVKVDGYRREYTLERPNPYNHTMLNARPAEKESMNAVVLMGLTDEQQDKIDSTESVYEKEMVPSDDLEFYGEDRSEDLPDEVPIYVLEDHPVLDAGTDRTRNELYHKRILHGIDNLPDNSNIDEETAAEFKQDFRESTYENSIVGGGKERPETADDGTVSEEWKREKMRWQNTVRQNDRAEEAYRQLIEDI
jgi:hypothetical protein